MRQSKTFLAIAACISVVALVGLCGCACKCPNIMLDQSDAVGTFMSLSKNPLDKDLNVEVAPARIRAINGEKVIWVFRNPSKHDIAIRLEHVRRVGTTPNVRDLIFSSNGGKVLIPKKCRYGFLSARLRTDVVASRFRTCERDTFYYNFMMFVGDTDSSIVRIPYDPELVVDGDP